MATPHAEEGWLLPCIRLREVRSLCRPLPQRQPREGRLKRFVQGELERACSRSEKGDGNENECRSRCREESGELCGCEGGDHGFGLAYGSFFWLAFQADHPTIRKIVQRMLDRHPGNPLSLTSS